MQKGSCSGIYFYITGLTKRHVSGRAFSSYLLNLFLIPVYYTSMWVF